VLGRIQNSNAGSFSHRRRREPDRDRCHRCSVRCADTAVIDADPVTVDVLDQRAVELEASWQERNEPLTRVRRMIRSGSYALVVRVEAQTVSLNVSGDPETRTDITVQEVVRAVAGAPPLPEPLWIRTPGGQVGDRMLSVSHVPRFSVGSTYLVIPSRSQIADAIERMSEEQLLDLASDQFSWMGALTLTRVQLESELNDLGKDLP
jgi:hypothetical protein